MCWMLTTRLCLSLYVRHGSACTTLVPFRGPSTPVHGNLSDSGVHSATQCQAARGKHQASSDGTRADNEAGPATSAPALASKTGRRTSRKATPVKPTSTQQPPHASSAPATAKATGRQPQTETPAPAQNDGSPAAPPATTKRTRTRSTTTSTTTAATPRPKPAPAAAGAPDPGGPPVQPQPQPELEAGALHTSPSQTLLIVDGNYIANRAYFGYRTRGLSTSKGVPTSITYSFLKTLQAAIQAVQPSALAVVFDPPGPIFRTVMSLMDPSIDENRELARSHRLDFQDLGNRILSLASVQADMLAAAQAEAAATARSYLQPSGFFLPPPPEPLDLSAPAALDAIEVPTPEVNARAAGTWEILTEALGPELCVELGLSAPHLGPEALTLLAMERPWSRLPSYKAGRTPHTETFHEDFRNLQRLLGLMSIPPMQRPWLEADDLAGLITQQAVRQGIAVRIVSGDRDLMQLVSDQHDVRLLYPCKDAAKSSGGGAGWRYRDFPFDELREAEVTKALGVPPALVPQYKALVGDASDRLPGVLGIGPKTAAKLLKAFGGIDGIRAALGEISAKNAAQIQTDWPNIEYTLAMLRVLGSPGACTLPPGVLRTDLLQSLELRGFDPLLVEPALLELEMHSLAQEVRGGGELWRVFGGGAGGGGGGGRGGT